MSSEHKPKELSENKSKESPPKIEKKSEGHGHNKSSSFPWFPSTGYGKLSIFLHFIIALALIALSVIELPKKGYGTTYVVFSAIGTFVWMIIWYYILSSLWACGKKGKELIVGLIIISEILLFIRAAMYFFSSPNTTMTTSTTQSNTPPQT